MIWTLHGFLGLPSDFDGYFKNIQSVNLYENICDFQDWAHSFNEKVRCQDPDPILLGYSMGGRLALHALLDSPDLYRAVILVSTHPGLLTLQEKEERIQQDLKWAERFLNDSWSMVLEGWERQLVFKGSKNLENLKREENYFKRERLAKCLTLWSLGRQRSFYDQFTHIKTPMLWLSGEYDTKFSQLLFDLPQRFEILKWGENKKCTHFLKYIIPQASHRAIWDQPVIFKDVVNCFLEYLMIP